jgi:DNA-binding MurR/RpiR family transcriptional regulator
MSRDLCSICYGMRKKAKVPSEDGDPFKARLSKRSEELTASAYRVAAYIDEHRATVLASSAADLAGLIGTSDATVVRAVQALGFTGIAEMKQELAASLQRPATPAEAMSRTLADIGGDTDRAIDLALGTHADAVNSLRTGQARSALTEAVQALHPADRVVVFGVGPSAPLAHYMSVLLSRHGRNARVLDATGLSLADQLLDMNGRDALLVMAYGRAYREITAVFAEAGRQRLPIVLISDSLDAQLARQASVVIPAKRGKASRAALHGATLVTLEALALGLAAADQRRSMDSLHRLNELRKLVAGESGAKA